MGKFCIAHLPRDGCPVHEFDTPILEGHGHSHPVCPVLSQMPPYLGQRTMANCRATAPLGPNLTSTSPPELDWTPPICQCRGDPMWVLKHVKLSRSVPKNKKIQYIQQSNTVFPHFFRFGCLGLGPALYSEVQKLHQHQGALPCWDVFSMFSSGTSGEAGSLFCKYLD